MSGLSPRLAGLLVLVGLRRLARLVVVLAIAETIVLSLPPVADALMASLQDQARVEVIAHGRELELGVEPELLLGELGAAFDDECAQ